MDTEDADLDQRSGAEVSEFTPDTEYVRKTFVSAQGPEDRVGPGFDAWLAEHDREVAERAWAQGRESLALDAGRPIGDDGFRPATPNPYRKDAR